MPCGTSPNVALPYVQTKNQGIALISKRTYLEDHPIPRPSMYGIYTYIWLIFIVNVGKYTSPMDCLGYLEDHPMTS